MSPGGNDKYRDRAMSSDVIAFSVSYEHDNLLARGLGLEHIRELLIRLARPILRRGASLAYGGHWKEMDGNFTFELLRLISAEQEDNSIGGPDTNLQIGILYNHASWPNYLTISRNTEAQWISACRIVRITQQQAGFADPEIVTDADSGTGTPRAIFNAAVTLSAMRRLAMTPLQIEVRGGTPEPVPPVSARILLGGKVESFSGFLPGLFEEALVTLEHQRPIYILGGFGGAAEVLASAILDEKLPAAFEADWLLARNPTLARLLDIAKGFAMPAGARTTQEMLGALSRFLRNAHANPAAVLCTGLSDDDTRELLRTRSVATAVSLVRHGLIAGGKLPA